MKKDIHSPFKSMTKEQNQAFFDADSDNNRYGKKDIEKDRKVEYTKQETKKAS